MARGSLAQNIVPNGSFELDTACPYALNQIYFCEGWTTGNEGTPDYYNECDSSSANGTYFAVPGNWMGYQRAFSGAAYAGFYGYSESPVADYHEYLMTKLPAMTPGVAYRVSMEVSLADSSGYESNGLGMLFNTYGAYPGVSTIPLAPQMNFSTFGVVTNTTGWTRLSGIFTPDSAYTYVVVGVFKDSSDIFKLQIKYPPLFHGFTYYYIDSIIVETLTNAGVPLVSNPLNINFYPNPLITGSATFSFDNPLDAPFNLQLYDILGHAVLQFPDVTTGSLKINRDNLPDGLYFYCLASGNGTAVRGKIRIGN